MVTSLIDEAHLFSSQFQKLDQRRALGANQQLNFKAPQCL